ncbi:MAG TPA: galactose-1-epimerase, partial [Bacteroidales bacterium]|nr:galactose-1-epimerase [Bacteroidales bacterium]
GFHTKLWDCRMELEDNSASLVLNYQSKHLEEGYPGNLDVTVTYRVTDDNTLHINFNAKTDKPTHINLTSHGYFNLSGFDDSIMEHKLMINANSYLETDENRIPTGTLIECYNTPLDFRHFMRLGDSILATSGGIDHCFELLNNGSIDNPAAILKHKPSGRSILIYTTQPGLQLYTGNSLDGTIKGHNETIYN